jgi:hypothetical protein
MSKSLSNITNLGTSFWKRLGQQAVQWIREDAKKGIMQTKDGNSNKPNYSPEYAKYKANDMRRSTVGKATGRGYTFDKAGDIKYKDLYFANKKAKTAIQRKADSTHGSGQRLKAYKGVSISNRDVSKVNMELTGQMFRGLRVVGVDNNGVDCAYQSTKENIGKIVGNQQKYNRRVVGLNDKNIEKARQLLIAEYKQKINENVENITINVRFG